MNLNELKFLFFFNKFTQEPFQPSITHLPSINNARSSINRVLDQYLNEISTNLSQISKQMVKTTANQSQKSKFECKKCPRKFFFLKGLVAHSKKHKYDMLDKSVQSNADCGSSEKNRLVCGYCKKKFLFQSYLTRHLRVHTGEAPFPCSQCGKRFKQSNSLKVHMRIHNKEKPFSCNICKREFSQISNLNVHRKRHN